MVAPPKGLVAKPSDIVMGRSRDPNYDDVGTTQYPLPVFGEIYDALYRLSAGEVLVKRFCVILRHRKDLVQENFLLVI
jgi:hypothetical protein